MTFTFRNRSNTSEESKRRESVKSLVSKASLFEYNPILKMLDGLTEQNCSQVKENLKLNAYCLKTALMMPIDEFVDINPELTICCEAVKKYTAYEELYGLMIVIEKRNVTVFHYLWESRGSLWSEKHLLHVIEYLLRTEWNEGINQLFLCKRTQEIFTAMYTAERRNLYDKLCMIADELLCKGSKKSLRLLSDLMKGLCNKPYSTLTFLLMFKYIHMSNTRIRAYDIDPSAWRDDIFKIVYRDNSAYQMAEDFNIICKSDIKQKAKYKAILTKLIDY